MSQDVFCLTFCEMFSYSSIDYINMHWVCCDVSGVLLLI